MVKARQTPRPESRRPPSLLALVRNRQRYPDVMRQVLGDLRLADGRTVAEHGRERVLKNLSEFYRKSHQVERLVHDFVAVYIRATRRLEAMSRIDPDDEKARARAFRAMAEDSHQFHEIIEAMQVWSKKNRPEPRIVPDDGSTLVERALRQHKLQRKQAKT